MKYQSSLPIFSPISLKKNFSHIFLKFCKGNVSLGIDILQFYLTSCFTETLSPSVIEDSLKVQASAPLLLMASLRSLFKLNSHISHILFSDFFKKNYLECIERLLVLHRDEGSQQGAGVRHLLFELLK